MQGVPFSRSLRRTLKTYSKRGALLYRLGSGTGYPGGLNGSTQHSGRTPLALKTKAESLASLGSPDHHPGWVLSGYSLQIASPGESIVASSD